MDFSLTQPVMNAAGSLGFAPDSRSGVNFSRFGAFITNPVSAGPRSPVQGDRFCPTPGGILLQTGHPNPGFTAVLHKYGRAWAHAALPVIVHVLGQHPDDIASMVRRLEEMENIMGVEVGLPPGVDVSTARMMIEAALGELLLIVRLPDSIPGSPEAHTLAEVALQAGVGALSLGPPRGLFYERTHTPAKIHQKAHLEIEPALKLLGGRLYGPAVLPSALHRVHELAGLGIPVIGAGGIYQEEDVQAMLAAGASAVQVDTALWRRMPWLY